MKTTTTHPNKRNLQSNTRAKQDLTNPARKPITVNIYNQKDKTETNLNK